MRHEHDNTPFRADRCRRPACITRHHRTRRRRHARRIRHRDHHRHDDGPVRRHGGAGQQCRQLDPHGVRRDQRQGRHQRPQDPLHRRGHAVPGPQGGAGDEQAGEPRQHLPRDQQRRHAADGRGAADDAREGRAECVSADLRTVDVRAAQQVQIRPVLVILRSDARLREVFRRSEGQEGHRFDVPGHRLRQGYPRRCRGPGGGDEAETGRRVRVQADRYRLQRAGQPAQGGRLRSRLHGNDRPGHDHHPADGAQDGMGRGFLRSVRDLFHRRRRGARGTGGGVLFDVAGPLCVSGRSAPGGSRGHRPLQAALRHRHQLPGRGRLRGGGLPDRRAAAGGARSQPGHLPDSRWKASRTGATCSADRR